MNDRAWEIFFDIHHGLPRQGPGDSVSTAKAFAMITGCPAKPRILDVGCGSGAQTVDLARLTDGEIVAVDNHQLFLDELRAKSVGLGLADRIHIVNGDMMNLAFEDSSFDFIWCEGAIFIIGFGNGLQQWRRFLKPRGFVAITEASWLKPNPPGELQEFWNECYPAIQDIQGNLRIIKDSGYQVLGHFTLPESSWWDSYYHPIERKLAELENLYSEDEVGRRVLAMERREIDMYRRYSESYGYVFYVMQS